MQGQQQLVAAGGLGLVAVNFWTSSQRPTVAATLFGGKGPEKTHTALLGIGGELLLVLVLYLVAGGSDSLGTGMVAVVAALWILWGIAYYGKGKG